MEHNREPSLEETEEWLENEEQEFLERLSNFGEGYFDLSIIQEIFQESGETGLAGT